MEDDLNGERFLHFLQTRLKDGDLLDDVPLQLVTYHWLHQYIMTSWYKLFSILSIHGGGLVEEGPQVHQTSHP